MTGRTLSDADVTAIVDKLKEEIVKDFYGEVGRGVWMWIKKAFFAMLILIAAYAVSQNKSPFGSIEVRR